MAAPKWQSDSTASSSLPLLYSATGRRRIELLSQATRPVPLKLQLLNPARRVRNTLDTFATGEHLACSSSLSTLSTSTSLPLILTRPGTRPIKINGGAHFKPDHSTIWGGEQYMHRQRRLRKVSSKYMDFMPAEGCEAAEQARRRQLNKHRSMMREAGRMFEKADKDKDGQLNFPEFFELCFMQSKLRRRAAFAAAGGIGKMTEEKKAWKRQVPLPTRRMLRDWFHVIDFDHSGSVSMTEFFVFSLREALAQAVSDGHGIATFLSVWELNTTDKIELKMFHRVAAALGVDSVTSDMLEECKEQEDKDGNLPIQYVVAKLRELAEGEAAKEFFEQASEVSQRPLDSLIGRKNGDSGVQTRSSRHGKNGPRLDAATSMAIMTELKKVHERMTELRKDAFYDSRDADVNEKEDVSIAMKILRSWLRKQGLSSLDLFQAWDHSGDYTLTRKELKAGLAQFGLELKRDLLTLVFDFIAAGYHATYDELREWLEGTTKSDGLSPEERQQQAARLIQKYIRARLVAKVPTNVDDDAHDDAPPVALL